MTFFMQLFTAIHSPTDNARNIFEANSYLTMHVHLKALWNITKEATVFSEQTE